MTEEEAYNRLRFLDDTAKLSWAEIGQICSHVNKTGIWKERCDSFPKWMRSAAPWGYATCFSAMRDVEAMTDVPAADLAEIPASNFKVMRQLSTSVRNDPRVLCAVKTKPTAELIEFVKAEFPDQHIEQTKMLRIPMDASAYAKVEEVLNMAMVRGAVNRSDAIEMICEETATQWRLEAEIESMVGEA